MNIYAQVLALLDSHYPHIEAWERIVYSYRVVAYGKVTGQPVPVNVMGLGEIMTIIDGWWMERMLENVI